MITLSAILIAFIAIDIVIKLEIIRYLENHNAIHQMEALLILVPVFLPFIGTVFLIKRLYDHIEYESRPETKTYRLKNKIFWDKVKLQKEKEEDRMRIKRGELTPKESRNGRRG